MFVKNKRIRQIVSSMIAAVLILLISGMTPRTASASSTTYLTSLSPDTYSYYFYINNWGGDAFTDVKGVPVSNGIGLTTSSGGRAYASYNVEGMGYKTFQAQISLDSQWLIGDFGKTAVGLYADGRLLYEKQLSKSTGVLPVNIQLPSDIEYFSIVVGQVGGAKGTQRVVVGNAMFSEGGSYLKTTDEVRELDTIGTYDESYYYYVKEWGGTAFQDAGSNIVTSGIGLTTSSGGRAYAIYNIDEMGYNVLETKLTLDSKWTYGDFGKTGAGIYADDHLLYEIQLTAKTPVQHLKLNIPKGTKEIKLVASQIKGAKGTQRVVFQNPVLKVTKDKPISVPSVTSVHKVGAADYSYYFYQNEWGGNAFQYVNGSIATQGLGLTTSGGGEAYATYNIAEMGFNAFRTKLSLDAQWIAGDYGRTVVYFYADDTALYAQELSKSSGIKDVLLKLPSTTKNFYIGVYQTAGAKGVQRVVFGDAVFATLSVSSKLTSSQVTVANNKGKSDVITVTSLLAGDVVKVYNAKGQLLASSKPATGASVTVTISQLGKTKGSLQVSRTSDSKLESGKIPVSFRGE